MPATGTKQIEIVVNGESRAMPDGLTLLEILGAAGVDPQRVAVELNGSIVRRADWDRTPVGAGSALEIVQFVGGG